MEKAKYRRLIIPVITVMLAVGMLAGFLLPRLVSFGGRREELIITNLDVGKADSAVITLGGRTGIIDTGTDEAYETIDSFLKNNNISGIDFLLITHYDRDHIGSAVELIENYPIDKILLPDYVSEKELYSPLMDCIADMDGVQFVDRKLSFDFGKAAVTVYPADDPGPLLENEKNRDNDMSLVSMLSYGSCRMLFTGDIENDRIKQMLDAGHDLSCDWIKIPHHGNYDKKDKALIKACSPVYAVVSTSPDVLDEKLTELIEDSGLKAYYTIYGNVTTVCSGSGIKVIDY
ncbi:MAG: MBL fold metallo-hydrolase [Lachnospiraceae bacterium]|nr:MBL fold metallo-hydrolase [Lachnospiraceae bacterium]